MDINEIRRISIVASTQGAAAATAQLNQLAAAQTNVASTAGPMGTSTDRAGASALSAAARVERLRLAHDTTYASAKRLEAGQRAVGLAFSQGSISSETASATLAALQKRYGDVTLATNAHASALGRHAAAMGSSRIGALELEHSVRAIGDGLASGINPLRLFSMEFSRLAEAASMSGGVGSLLRGAGGMLGGMLRPLVSSPMGIAATIGVGVAGAVGGSYLEFERNQDRLYGALNGPGRATGLNAQRLADIADAASDRSGLSRGAGYGLAATYAQSGRIDPDLIDSLTGSSRAYSRVTGAKSLAEGGEDLASSFSNPTKGVDALNGKLLAFDAATRQTILSLDASGQHYAAQKLMIEGVNNVLMTSVDRTWSFSKTLEGMASAASSAADKIGAAVQRSLGPTIDQQMETARANLANAEARGAQAEARQRQATQLYGRAPAFDVAQSDRTNLADIVRAREEMTRLSYQQYDSARMASARAVEAAGTKWSLETQGNIDAGSPDAAERRRLTERANELASSVTDARNDPSLRGRLVGGFDAGTGSPIDGFTALQQAADAAANKVAYLATATQRLEQDSALAAAETMARTATERTALEAQRAWLEVIRDQGTAAQAAAAATSKWTDAIAQSNKQAEDLLIKANDRADMIGKSPLQRSVMEIENQFRDYRKNSVFSPGATTFGPLSSLDRSMTALDIGVGGSGDRTLLNYSRNIAPKIATHAGQDALWNNYLSATTPAAPAAPAATAAADAAPWSATHSADDLNQIKRTMIGTALSEQTTEVMRKANEELERQQKLLDIRAGAWGRNTDVVNKAIAAQEAWNRLALTDDDKAMLGPTRMANITTQVNQDASTTADQQRQQREQQQQLDQINTLNDGLRSFTSGSLSDVFNDFSQSTTKQDILSQLTRGQQNSYYTGHTSLNRAKLEAAQRQVQTLASHALINFGVGELTKGFFGSGSPGSQGYQPGLLGGLLNGALGGFGGLFSGGGGGASGGSFAGLDSLLGNGGFFPSAHTGAIVGPGMASSRFVDPSVFAGAPRFHSGGIAGDEVPLIAKKNEGIFTPAQMKAMGSGGGTTHNWNIQQGDVIVQGNADGNAINQMRAEMAASEARMTKQITRNLGTIQSQNARLYG